MQELKIEMVTSADYNKTLRAIYETKDSYYDLLCAIYELAKKNNVDLTFERVVELKVIRYGVEFKFESLEIDWINEDLQNIIKEKGGIRKIKELELVSENVYQEFFQA